MYVRNFPFWGNYFYICQKYENIVLVLIYFYRCHVCKKEMTTIPALKTHIKQHSYKKSWQ